MPTLSSSSRKVRFLPLRGIGHGQPRSQGHVLQSLLSASGHHLEKVGRGPGRKGKGKRSRVTGKESEGRAGNVSGSRVMCGPGEWVEGEG